MSRIIAGQWKGHSLPNLNRGPVRPTSSRTRTVLFDTLARPENAIFLDLFSGSGSLGFEALSRGAARLVSVDKQTKYIREQKIWIKAHEADHRYEGFPFEVDKFIAKTHEIFDVILMDPPYDLQFKADFWNQLVQHLKANGWLVYECARRANFEMPVGVELSPYKSKQMGDSVLNFYRRGNV